MGRLAQTGLLVSFEPVSNDNLGPKHPDQFSKDLAEAVNSLFRSSEKIRTMGRESRKRAEKDFRWKSVARQTMGFTEN